MDALIEWGVATRPLAGETGSGDSHVVAVFPHGALAAVVDGLGHGPDAAAAARTAASTLEAHAQEPVVPLVRRCHEVLRGTRGAVLGLGSFNARDETLTWLAVGNVEGVLLRANAGAAPAAEYLLQRGGVVGYDVPRLQAAVIPVARGDMLILATDGIHTGFAHRLRPADSPQHIADEILAAFGKSTDDALVLVARWLGGAA